MAVEVTHPLPGVHHLRDALGVCCTLLAGERAALLVDTGYGLDDMRAITADLTDKPLTLWLTHGHHDHALGARWFPQVRLHPADGEVYATYTGADWRSRVAESAAARGLPLPADFHTAEMPRPTLAAGEVVDLGGMAAHVLPCPGHTPGSVVVWVPERQLLLTGDNWNPTTWLFFPEALDVWAWRQHLAELLELPFTHVLCPHDGALQPRGRLEAFLGGLTDAAIRAAQPVDVGYPQRTLRVTLPEHQQLVFDGDKAGIE